VQLQGALISDQGGSSNARPVWMRDPGGKSFSQLRLPGLRRRAVRDVRHFARVGQLLLGMRRRSAGDADGAVRQPIRSALKLCTKPGEEGERRCLTVTAA